MTDMQYMHGGGPNYKVANAPSRLCRGVVGRQWGPSLDDTHGHNASCHVKRREWREGGKEGGWNAIVCHLQRITMKLNSLKRGA